MIRSLFLVSIVFLLLPGCASLTDSQIKSVNQFAEITNKFSAFPGKIMTELAAIRVERGTYYANTLTDPKLHIGELDSIFSQKIFDYQISEKVDVTFKIIDTYSQSLLLLSSDKYIKDIAEQSEHLGVGLDSLVSKYNAIDPSAKLPVGIGQAISKLIILGGSQYVKAKQAKEIKRFVLQADTIVSKMTSNLLDYLESETINDLILFEEKEITRNYLSYLQLKPNVSIENERDYLSLKNRIYAVKQLQSQTIKATRNLKECHHRLALEISKKKNLKQTIEGFQEMYSEIKDLKKALSNIEKL